MKNVTDYAEKIEQIIAAIRDEGKRTEELIQSKAEAMANYDKAVGMAVAALRAGGEPVSVIDKLAKERACSELLKRVVAEETLKAHYCRIGYLESQLNGYQSLFRHLQAM